MLGQEVAATRTDSFLNKLQIDQPGVYIIRVNIDGKMTAKRVIIQ